LFYSFLLYVGYEQHENRAAYDDEAYRLQDRARDDALVIVLHFV